MNVDVFSNVLLAGALCAIAFLIGATSIGGVLLGPALNILGDAPLHVAIPGCMFAFIFTGSVGRIGILKRQYTLVEKYRMGWSAWFES